MRRISCSLQCLLLWLLVLTFLPVFTANAQPPEEQLGANAVFLQLFPELRNLPAPEWFRPGARASYQVDEYIIVQFDAVISDGPESIASARTFVEGHSAKWQPLRWSSIVGLPALGEYWIHPDVLTRAEQVANENLTVSRFDKDFAGQTYAVVRFESTLGGATSFWEFDESSGLLLHDSKYFSDPETGLPQLAQRTLLNFRQIQPPWPTGRAPNWVRRDVEIEYEGLLTQIIRLGPPPVRYGMHAVLSPTARTWSLDTVTTFIDGTMDSTAVQVSGVGQIFGGLWIPREALEQEIGGSPITIDTDPVTGVTTTLYRNGSNEIVLRQSGETHSTEMYYNPLLGSLDRLVQRRELTLSATTIIDITRTGGDDLAALNELPELPLTYLPKVGRVD